MAFRGLIPPSLTRPNTSDCYFVRKDELNQDFSDLLVSPLVIKSTTKQNTGTLQVLDQGVYQGAIQVSPGPNAGLTPPNTTGARGLVLRAGDVEGSTIAELGSEQLGTVSILYIGGEQGFSRVYDQLYNPPSSDLIPKSVGSIPNELKTGMLFTPVNFTAQKTGLHRAVVEIIIPGQGEASVPEFDNLAVSYVIARIYQGAYESVSLGAQTLSMNELTESQDAVANTYTLEFPVSLVAGTTYTLSAKSFVSILLNGSWNVCSYSYRIIQNC